MGRHCTSGFPVVEGGQLQRGSCATGVHSAPIPHAPGHGSTQRLLIHASRPSQSFELRHSCRQKGGDPRKLSLQRHRPSTQSAFGPQSAHGEFFGSVSRAGGIKIFFMIFYGKTFIIGIRKSTYVQITTY